MNIPSTGMLGAACFPTEHIQRVRLDYATHASPGGTTTNDVILALVIFSAFMLTIIIGMAIYWAARRHGVKSDG